MVQSSSNPLDPKYRVLCGAVHVEIIIMLICSAGLTYIIKSTPYGVVEPRDFGSKFFQAVLVALISGSGIHAVCTKKAKWLMPCLISFGVMLYFLFLTIVCGLVSILIGPEEILSYVGKWDGGRRRWDDDHDKENTTRIVFFFLISVGLFALVAWMFFVVYRCFQYYVAKRAASLLPTQRTSSVSNPTFTNGNDTKPILEEIDL